MQARVFISQKTQFWMMQLIQSDPNMRQQEMVNQHKRNMQKQVNSYDSS